MNSYVSLDLEATGLNPKYEKVIEIGAVKVIGGIKTDSFSTFVNPGRKLEKRITDITGITDEDLKDAPLIKDVIKDLTFFCEDLPLVGHRILFDYSFVKQACINNGLIFEKEGIDTLKISRACFYELPSKRLGDMCAHYDIKLKAHRALNDAEATAELYECLKNDFLFKKPEIFKPERLIYKVKRESPIRSAQLEKLKDYIGRHNIDCPYDLETLSRNEASRYYDKLCAEFGK